MAVLGLVAAASLKLTALAEKSLSSARDYEELLDIGTQKYIELMLDPVDSFGISGDVKWNVTDRHKEMTLEDRIAMVALVFDDPQYQEQLDRFKEQELRWRELEVEYRGRKIVFLLPFTEEYARHLSDDSRQDIKKR